MNIKNQNKILQEIKEERKRQFEKFGDQHLLPSVDKVLNNRPGGCTPELMCEHYEIPSEPRAKFLCENSQKKRECTFTHIVVEELSESVSAKDDDTRRGELVQLAACVVQWIEAIDTKYDKEKDLRYILCKTRLESMSSVELNRIVTRTEKMLFDTFNFNEGKFCPIAIGMNLHELIDNPTDENVKKGISERFSPTNIFKGTPGRFYTTNRKDDIVNLCKEIIGKRKH